MVVGEGRDGTISVTSAPPGERRSSGGDHPGHRQRWVEVGSILIVVVAGIALLAQSVNGAQEVTALHDPSNISSWKLDNAFFSCLTGQVTDVVPPGSSVYLPVQISDRDPEVLTS